MSTVDFQKLNDAPAIIRAVPLLHGIDDKKVADIIANGRVREFKDGDLAYDSGSPVGGIGIVLSGCLGIVDTRAVTERECVIDSILMPYQPVGEFQFLKHPFPNDLELMAFANTQVFEFDEKVVNAWCADERCVFLFNLGRSLVDKVEIANMLTYLRCISQVAPKIAEFLKCIRLHPILRNSVSIYGKTKLLTYHVTWTVSRLSQFLSCTHKSLIEALVAFHEVGAGDLVWFDDKLNEISGIELADVSGINNRGSKLKHSSRFRFTKVEQSGIKRLSEQRR